MLYPSRQIGPNYEDRLAWARSFGVDFFLFDTYYKPEINYQENLVLLISLSLVSGLPCVTVRSCSCNCFFGAWSAFTHVIANTAAQSLATLYIKSSDNFVASAAVSIATGGANQFHGGTRTR